jgi:hypothetical protein
MAKLAAVVFQIAALAFLLWFVQPIKPVLPVAVILVFAVIYLFGVRFISNWLQLAIRQRAP